MIYRYQWRYTVVNACRKERTFILDGWGLCKLIRLGPHETQDIALHTPIMGLASFTDGGELEVINGWHTWLHHHV